MKSLLFLLLITALILPEVLQAKNKSPDIKYISISAGGYLINLENFDEVYDSKMIFVFGAKNVLSSSSHHHD